MLRTAIFGGVVPAGKDTRMAEDVAILRRAPTGRHATGQRGQAAVEFMIFFIMTFLSLMLIVQLVWIGIQKWQFNHFAGYAARVWAVHKDDEPGDSLRRIEGAALFLRWNLLSRDYVKFMWVSSEDAKEIDDENYSGITYSGVAPLLPLFRDVIGETLFDNPIPSEVSSIIPIDLPTSGLVRFETFIPMEKEPEEQPDISNRDNDCEDTPCTKGNGR